MNYLLASGLYKAGQITVIGSIVIVLIGELFGNSWSMVAGGVGLLVGLYMVWCYRPSQHRLPPGAFTREAFAAHLAQSIGCQSLGEGDPIDDVQVFGLMLDAKRAFEMEFSTPHHHHLHVGQVVDDLYSQYLDYLKASG